MNKRVDCPHCDDGMATDGNLCGWCHGFGEMIEFERVCTACLPGEKDCPCCGGTHRQKRLRPAMSRFELQLLPSDDYLEEK